MPDEQVLNVEESTVTNQIDAKTEKQEAVSFTQKQQEIINNLITEKYKVAYKKAEDKYKSDYDKLSAELNELKKGSKKEHGVETTPDPNKELQDKLSEALRVIELNKASAEMFTERQKSLQTELEAERSARLQERKTNTLLAAAQKQKFIDPNVVVKLTEHLVSFDTEHNSWRIRNEDGQDRWNDKLAPMSVDEFMSEFASNHKYLVQGSNIGGTGQTESNGKSSSRTFTRTQIANMPQNEYNKLRDEIFKAQKEGRVT